MRYFQYGGGKGIVAGNQLDDLFPDIVLDDDVVKILIFSGVLTEVVNPSIIDLLNSGNKTAAVMRYVEIHGKSALSYIPYSFAKKQVSKIQHDMERFSRKGKNQ